MSMTFPSLADKLRSGPLSLSEANRVFTQIAGELDSMHRGGVFYQRLKPSAVAFDEHDNASLVEESLATPGAPEYMSPEEVRGERLDARAHVYSLAALAYHALTGRPPFEGVTEQGILFKQATEPPRPPRELRPDLPEGIDAVLLKGLAKRPDERYQTATEFARAFSAAVGGWAELDTIKPTALTAASSVTRVAPTEAIPSGTEPAAQLPPGKRRELAPWLVLGAVGVLGVCLCVSSSAAIYRFAPVALATPQPFPTMALVLPEPTFEHYGGTWFWWSANFSPDGKRIVTTQDDHNVRVWDAQTGKQVGAQAARWDFHGALFSPDGSRILTPDGGLQAEACIAAVWDQTLEKQLTCMSGRAGALLDARYNPEGTQIVTAGQDGTTRVWDAATGKQLKSLGNHDYFIEQAHYSPDGKQIAAESGKQHVEIWDAATGKILTSLSVWRVAYSPDSKRIVVAEGGNSASVLDTATWSESLVLTGHTDAVLGATYSPDGTQILTRSTDKTARVWDAQTGRQVAILDVHPLEITDAMYSPDSRYIVIAISGGSTQVWDAKTGARVTAVGPRGNGAGVVAFSPDGTRFFSGNFDGSAHVWDTATWKELVTWNLETANAAPQPGQTLQASEAPLLATQVASPAATLTTPPAAQAPTQPSPNGTVVLSDSFDENRNGWETSSYYGDTFKTAESITGGKYVWDVKANHSPALDWELPKMADVTDFSSSVDARQMSGTPHGRYGLIFRWMGDQNFYLFDIADDGTFKVSQANKENPGRALLTGQSAVVKPGEANRLTVTGRGSHFSFFVNGHYLADLDNGSLTYGSVGVAVELPNEGDEAVVEFDNFEVRAP